MASTAIPEPMLKAIASHINMRYPLVHNPLERKLNYGTAGFRTTGTLLPPVAARVVIIAVLRAWQCTAAAIAGGHTRGATLGFMITASHNPAQDNGFKIIDEDGGMLSPTWEPWCGKIANAITGEEVADVVRECVETEKIRMQQDVVCNFGSVQVGRDTRGSGEVILDAVKDMLDTILRISYTDHGVVTTPQLHFIVYKANQTKVQEANIDVNVGLYNKEILTAFDDLATIATEGIAGVPRRLVVDASNGVGAVGLEHLLQYAKDNEVNGKTNAISQFLDISLVNTHVDNTDILNKECGAEYAHKKQTPSAEMQQWARNNGAPTPEDDTECVHYYCLDGDADRLISFALAGTGQWRMIDGDRTSILYSLLLHEWLGAELMEKLDIGIVQTAYANGASTDYVEKKLGMRVYKAATGVKNLHPIAHARDIGVYFEANGHGTVLFKPALEDKISSTKVSDGRVKKILETLPRLLSQVCGDAIADMLMCEVAMRALRVTPTRWAELYTDRPSLQTTVTVPNPQVITNTEDETRALTPPGLQEAIDAAVEACRQSLGGGDSVAARSFVRPSGTEPIVRVYAEAPTREAAEALAEEVKKLVEKFCS